MKNSISLKFIIIVLLLTFVLFAVLAFITITISKNTLSEQAGAFVKVLKEEQANEEELLRTALQRKGKSIMDLLAQNGAMLIVSYEFDNLAKLAENGGLDPEVDYVVFYDETETAITPDSGKTESSQVLKQDVMFLGSKVGYVEVGLNDTAVQDNIRGLSSRIEKIITNTADKNQGAIAFTILITTVISIVGVLLLCSAIFLLLLYIVIKPIQKVIHFAEKMSEGDLLFRLDNDDEKGNKDDEVGQLLAAMSYMAESLRKKAEAAEKISHGDLGTDVTLTSEADILGQAFQKMLNTLRTKVEIANQIARGNLSVDVILASENDTLGKALQGMVENLNALLSKVNTTAIELKQNSAKISNASHNLAQGANEQAASLEEITSSMEELESQTRSNSDNANNANQQATEANTQAEEGNVQMKSMLQAMGEINSTSEQISNIIKTIDEIAFQTNVLAINAAVEAARAGVHGKGFAVVAEEVRNLAQRSADASKETTAMIKTSIKRIEAGAKAADETAQSLTVISSGTTNVTKLVQDISAASQEQTLGVTQINQGLNQLNTIVQTNASIAEQSASASENLDAQANILSQLVSNFQLKAQGPLDSDGGNRPFSPVARQLPLPGSERDGFSDSDQFSTYESEADETEEDFISFNDENLGRF